MSICRVIREYGVCCCQICDPRGKIVTIDRRVMAFIIVVSIIFVNLTCLVLGYDVVWGLVVCYLSLN